MALYRGLSARSSPLSHVSLLVLRLGCVGILVFYHGWAEGHAAWSFLWTHEPWALVGTLKTAGFPYPATLAVTAASICALASLTLTIGFLTRLSAFLILVVLVAATPISLASPAPIHRELHSFYLLGFSLIVLLGGGRHALDTIFLRSSRV